ncbi:MAG: excinuclease ABC subunit UvrC [Planctomycetes bacterium]|nr:excinuclease ABC subunit UvrC [Planctomycetota bacterium]
MDGKQAELRRQAAALPREPGVYIFKDARGQVLYIGKARDLRARVQSYFTEGGDGRLLIPYLQREARDLDYVATPNEFEALLLENRMIREERPRYNIRLRDDKSYVSLRYDPREAFSRLEVVRRVKRDGARYLGPFLSAGAVRETLRLILPIHPLRLCSDAVFRNRSRPCVYHQIGRCPAPCVGKITPEAYRENLEGAVRLLRGRERDRIEALRTRMWAAAEAHDYEAAATLRDQIGAAEQTIENARVVASGQLDRDVFGLAREGERLVVEVLTVREGRLLGARAHAFSSPLDDDEVLTSFLVQYYGGDRGVPRQVLLGGSLREGPALERWLRDKRGRAVRLAVAARGEGRKLVAMATRNAVLALERGAGRSADTARCLERLRERLGLGRDPVRMEAYDISHTGGGETVGVAVAFEHGEPARESYRKFQVRTVRSGDDYAAMEEVLRRRFARLVAEDEPRPDLLVIDGGLGQLNRVRAVLKEVGIDAAELDVIALAKGRARADHEERIHVAGRGAAIRLEAGSAELLLLDRLRDEAHRFAITYHRKLRSRARVSSALDGVPGVGPRLRARILAAFGSVQALKGKGVEEIAARAGVPLRVARRVQERLG